MGFKPASQPTCSPSVHADVESKPTQMRCVITTWTASGEQNKQCPKKLVTCLEILKSFYRDYLVTNSTLAVTSCTCNKRKNNVSSHLHRKLKKRSLKTPIVQTQHNSLYTSKQDPTKLSMPLCVTEE